MKVNHISVNSGVDRQKDMLDMYQLDKALNPDVTSISKNDQATEVKDSESVELKDMTNPNLIVEKENHALDNHDVTDEKKSSKFPIKRVNPTVSEHQSDNATKLHNKLLFLVGNFPSQILVKFLQYEVTSLQTLDDYLKSYSKAMANYTGDPFTVPVIRRDSYDSISNLIKGMCGHLNVSVTVYYDVMDKDEADKWLQLTSEYINKLSCIGLPSVSETFIEQFDDISNRLRNVLEVSYDS